MVLLNLWRRGRRVTLGVGRVWCGVAIMAIAAVVLGCSVRVEAAELTVYSARHYSIDQALYEGFTKATGIAVRVVVGDEDELLDRLGQEGAESPADLLVTVDAGRLWRAQERGLLQPVISPALDNTIPPQYREAHGYWYGLSLRARLLVYHVARVSPSELSTYEDLADPKWKGRLLIRSSNSYYNRSLVGSILAADGDAATVAWARGLVANLARPPVGTDNDQLRALIAGVGDVAVVNSYYFARLATSPSLEDRQAAAHLAVFFPNQGGRGTHVNISGAGVPTHAPHPDFAVKLLEYLVTPAAQKMFAEGNYEYPVVPGLPVHPVIAAWGPFTADTMNAAVFGSNNAEAARIMNRVGWN